MTTRRLSSRRELQATSASLLDCHGQPLFLGRQIGRGGEGSVFEVEGDPSLVAKIYHQVPLPDEQIAKLEVMVSRWSPDLQVISGWPRSLVYEAHGRACGMLMPHVRDGRHLHELYGTTNRRRHFPGALWHHLVLAARNAAAAFHTMHAAGIVVGDVNQGNLLVDPQMCVRLIDCDSFQVSSDGKTFTCPVGTPHFTPPELQSKKLRGIVRTADHDAFGLAVLVFHLLFVGRHPFAGRYRGSGELPIARAIAEGRFAFSMNRAATLVDPPPASLRLEDLPTGLARLFEASFCATPRDTARPGPLAWVRELEGLIAERTTCAVDGLHVYYQGLRECPWCRIEGEGGPAFFVSADSASLISTDRLAHLDRCVAELRPVRFPRLSAGRLAIGQAPPLRQLTTSPGWTWTDTAATCLACSAALGLAGVFLAPALWVAVVLAPLAGAVLLWSKEGRARRRRVFDFLKELDDLRRRLLNSGRDVMRAHEMRARGFGKAASELKTAVTHYHAPSDQLQDVLLQQRDDQKAAFLRGHLVRDHAGSIPGLKPGLLSMLESFGIESAYDVDNLSLCGIPNISSSLMIELLQWRSQLESEFEFRPEHGVTVGELHATGDAAMRRFKLSQARKVLMGARQVEALAHAGEIELAQALARYEAGIGHWRAKAGQLRDFQSARRRLERSVNRSATVIAACAVGIPLVALVLRILFN